MTFGIYLKQLRQVRNLRQQDLAKKINVSIPYVCDIEKDRRYPPDFLILQTWETQLNLNETERAQFYNLAGIARNSLPPDICKYLSDNPSALTAIRRIMVLPEGYNWNKLTTT
ncbi:MAG: helix-turn-helix transcriptional regulator [Faecalibacterium sp.]